MTKKPKKINTGSVCYAHISFQEDAARGKRRPSAVLMEATSEVQKGTGVEPVEPEYLCYPITSKKPPEQYLELYYEIQDYSACGLTKTSYIKCQPSQLRLISESALDYQGELHPTDLVNFLTKVNELSIPKAAKKEA